MILVTEKFWSLVKHRNQLKLGNLASGYKIAHKALNRFILAVWGIANGIRIPAQTRVIALTAIFVNEIKSLWLIDFFG